jgi:hypothetical protein
VTIAGKNSLPGETPGQKLVRIVRKYVGCSLLNRADELGTLVARGVDDPKKVVGIKTNCGMFALGVMAEAGVQHALLDRPYVVGMAIGWVLQIARERGALVTMPAQLPFTVEPPVGALLHYGKPGTNNDHVEWLLSEVAPSGAADTAGGGRPNNAITAGRYVITRNAGRPLLHWVDPTKLGIEVVPAGSDINEAYGDA